MKLCSNKMLQTLHCPKVRPRRVSGGQAVCSWRPHFSPPYVIHINIIHIISILSLFNYNIQYRIWAVCSWRPHFSPPCAVVVFLTKTNNKTNTTTLLPSLRSIFWKIRRFSMNRKLSTNNSSFSPLQGQSSRSYSQTKKHNKNKQTQAYT